MGTLSNRRKREENFNEMLDKAASKGTEIGVGEVEVARNTVASFLKGIFYQDYGAPDVEHMEEAFFESTQDGIEQDIESGITREFYSLEMLDFNLEDADNFYSPKQAAYKCTFSYDFKYWPRGKRGTSFRTKGCRDARFFFSREDDLWVLYGWKDLGECDAPPAENLL